MKKSSTVLLAVAFISSVQAGDLIKIMPVGDSITAGEHFGYPAIEERTGYRKDLYWMLTDAGYSVDFVGPEKHGERPESDPDWFDWNSDAIPGASISQFCFKITEALEEYKPDILLNHLGTNGGAWQRQAFYNMYYLDRVNEFAVANNHPITVFLCQFINRYPGGNHPETSQLNKDIADSVATRTGDMIKIILVDMERGAGFDYSDADPDPNASPPYPGGDMWGTKYPGVAEDFYHPNDRGNYKMAAKFFEELVKELGEPTSVENQSPLQPQKFEMYQNYPNPFNPVTTIQYQLSEAAIVSLTVYNAVGQKVAVLENKYQPAGLHQTTWNAEGLDSGIYVYKLIVGNVEENKKLVFMK